MSKSLRAKKQELHLAEERNTASQTGRSSVSISIFSSLEEAHDYV